MVIMTTIKIIKCITEVNTGVMIMTLDSKTMITTIKDKPPKTGHITIINNKSARYKCYPHIPIYDILT